MKISLATTHCPWVPERVETMRRLRNGLGLEPFVPMSIKEDPTKERTFVAFGSEKIHGDALPSTLIAYREERERGTNDQWSEKIWQWSAMQEGADWCAFGQEDVIPMPGFWGALVAMLEALPLDAEILGLQATHPLIRSLALEGHRWCTSADMLIGPFWVIRRESLLKFLTWRENELREGWREPTSQKLPQLTEDTMVGVWALATGRKIWHPIPTIIDHDTSIPSTSMSNDTHEHRRPPVTWEAMTWTHDAEHAIDSVGFWMPYGVQLGEPWHVPHLGRFYEATPSLAYKWVKGVTSADFVRMRANDGRELKRRLAEQVRGMRPRLASPVEKVLVLSPLRDEWTHAGYNSTLLRMVRAEGVDLIELEDAWRWQDDLIRVRSRMWRRALETDATVFWHLDGDVEAAPTALLGMLKTGRDFVFTPYPRRGRIDFNRVRTAPPTIPAEAMAYLYGVRALPEEEGKASAIHPDGCLLIGSAPLGCSMIRRAAVEKMLAHYEKPLTPPEFWGNVAETWLRRQADEDGFPSREAVLEDLKAQLQHAYELGQKEPDLCFDDLFDGLKSPSVAVFMMMIKDRELLSEDFTICERARAIGIDVALYLGPGSPATHHGAHAYRGHLEAFGLQRQTTEG